MTHFTDRMPPIDPSNWTQEQKVAAEEVINGPRGALISPFVPMLRSPEFMTHAQRMGEYLRYRSALGLSLSEFVILLVAQLWAQPVEWAIHAPIAEKNGVSLNNIKDIAEGKLPQQMNAREKIAYEFSMELQRNRYVSDATWQTAITEFGEKGVIDLIGLNGYYAMLAMTMNAARTSVPMNADIPLQHTMY